MVSRALLTAATLLWFALALNVHAGTMDADPDASIFGPSSLSGFSDLPLAPALTSELPSLYALPTEDSSLIGAMSTADWSSGQPEIMPHQTSTVQAKWVNTEGDGEDGTPPVSGMKLVLVGILGILGITLVGLAVGFYTLRGPAPTGFVVRIPR